MHGHSLCTTPTMMQQLCRSRLIAFTEDACRHEQPLSCVLIMIMMTTMAVQHWQQPPALAKLGAVLSCSCGHATFLVRLDNDRYNVALASCGGDVYDQVQHGRAVSWQQCLHLPAEESKTMWSTPAFTAAAGTAPSFPGQITARTPCKALLTTCASPAVTLAAD